MYISFFLNKHTKSLFKTFFKAKKSRFYGVFEHLFGKIKKGRKSK